MFESQTSILIYIGIFLAKLIEVSLATLRAVLNNRGQKLVAATIGFFEVMLWIYLASIVLKDVSSDPLKVVVYCLAFSCGNYVGVTLEEKIALGMSVIEILVSETEAKNLAKILRDEGYGVTTIESYGKEDKKVIVKTYLKRKQLNHAVSIIKQHGTGSFFSISDVKSLVGGYIKK